MGFCIFDKIYMIKINNIPTTKFSENELITWVLKLSKTYKVEVDRFVVNFSDEERILYMNEKYLNHDTHTDILTFSYGDSDLICSEIFISEQMCRMNAKKYNQTIENECLRLISHGFLHSLGYNDGNPKEKALMTEQENFCVNMFHVKQ